jgi:hypothetical protein
VATLRLAETSRRKTAVLAATSRKRLLMGRYLGWAHGTSRHPHGLVGPAGEAAVRQAILQSGRVVPLTPGAGEINRILNVRLPGALDSGGFMIPIVDGVPQAPVTVLMEVKNLRSWIYPSSQELFQVLYKGAVVQRAAPAQPIVPVLICRKAHTTTFWMAHQLGFIVIDMGVQFVGDVPATRLDEVRNERHFSDIRLGAEPARPGPALLRRVAGQVAGDR